MTTPKSKTEQILIATRFHILGSLNELICHVQYNKSYFQKTKEKVLPMGQQQDPSLQLSVLPFSIVFTMKKNEKYFLITVVQVYFKSQVFLVRECKLFSNAQFWSTVLSSCTTYCSRQMRMKQAGNGTELCQNAQNFV